MRNNPGLERKSDLVSVDIYRWLCVRAPSVYINGTKNLKKIRAIDWTMDIILSINLTPIWPYLRAKKPEVIPKGHSKRSKVRTFMKWKKVHSDPHRLFYHSDFLQIFIIKNKARVMSDLRWPLEVKGRKTQGISLCLSYTLTTYLSLTQVSIFCAYWKVKLTISKEVVKN